MDKPKYQRQGRDYWQALIAEFSESQMTQKEYCQQNNISFSTFANWKSKLEKEALKRPAFVEIPQENFPPESTSMIELVSPDGYAIRVSENISTAVLMKIFNALRSMSC